MNAFSHDHCCECLKAHLTILAFVACNMHDYTILSHFRFFKVLLSVGSYSGFGLEKFLAKHVGGEKMLANMLFAARPCYVLYFLLLLTQIGRAQYIIRGGKLGKLFHTFKVAII